MKHLLFSTTALVLGALTAQAGGVDRSGQSLSILYEPGNIAQFTYGRAYPDVSGVQTAMVGPFPPGGSSGDSLPTYRQRSISYKHAFGNGFDGAFIIDEPFGARIDYPEGRNYFASGADAKLGSIAWTGALKYTFPSNLSIFGGIRYQSFWAEAFIPYATVIPGVTPPYDADGDRDEGWGYLVGIGYEIPEIAARVSLTYNSSVEHELTTTESSFRGNFRSMTEVETPQSINLEFETGIAPDTLLFGGVRWVDWSEFEIAPIEYRTITGLAGEELALVSYEEDTFTYTLGVGRQLTERFAGALTFAYEPQVGGFASNLGPTDGRFAISVGGTYSIDPVSITAGVSYVWIGDAETRVGGSSKVSEWEDNTAVGAGIEIAYRF